MPFVAIKMGRRQGARRELSESIRDRRATQPPAHFHRNPLGRGQLVVFPRCSLDPYGLRYGRFARALKNSQLTYGKRHVISATGHQPENPYPAPVTIPLLGKE
jgi:hypothetical protein